MPKVKIRLTSKAPSEDRIISSDPEWAKPFVFAYAGIPLECFRDEWRCPRPRSLLGLRPLCLTTRLTGIKRHLRTASTCHRLQGLIDEIHDVMNERQPRWRPAVRLLGPALLGTSVWIENGGLMGPAQ
jgi:hypothetical protein